MQKMLIDLKELFLELQKEIYGIKLKMFKFKKNFNQKNKLKFF